MPTMNISLSKELASIVDKEIKEGKYANRSEFFRDILRKQFIQKSQSPENIDYYKTLDQTLKDAWGDSSNDDIFLIKKKRKR